MVTEEETRENRWNTVIALAVAALPIAALVGYLIGFTLL
jgi:hypothetical protein